MIRSLTSCVRVALVAGAFAAVVPVADAAPFASQLDASSPTAGITQVQYGYGYRRGYYRHRGYYGRGYYRRGYYGGGYYGRPYGYGYGYGGPGVGAAVGAGIAGAAVGAAIGGAIAR